MTGTTEPALPIAQFLWIGSKLSRLERLSIRSFLDHGHECHLYAYEDMGQVPAGTVLKDANEIIPHRQLFATKRGYGGFSDLFRWQLLHRKGQLWIDTDIICLKPFDFDLSATPLFAFERAKQLPLSARIGFAKGKSFSLGVFTALLGSLISTGTPANSRLLRLVGTAVLGFPRHHHLTAHLAAQSAAPNTVLPYDTLGKKIQRRFNRLRFRKIGAGDNIGPIYNAYRIGETGPPELTRAAMHFGLIDLAKPAHYFYPISGSKTELNKIFGEDGSMAALDNSYSLHAWGSAARPMLDKNWLNSAAENELQHRYPESSLFEQLCRRHGID